MASGAPDNWVRMSDDDESKGFESSGNSSCSLLMTLLEETQVEECNEERLTSLIQSLEEEINPKAMDEGTSAKELELKHDNGKFHPWEPSVVETHNSVASPDDAEISFDDAETASLFPGDDMSSWCQDSLESENTFVPQEMYDALMQKLN